MTLQSPDTDISLRSGVKEGEPQVKCVALGEVFWGRDKKGTGYSRGMEQSVQG